MRRSAAPSKIGGGPLVKRTKFVPPSVSPINKINQFENTNFKSLKPTFDSTTSHVSQELKQSSPLNPNLKLFSNVIDNTSPNHPKKPNDHIAVPSPQNEHRATDFQSNSSIDTNNQLLRPSTERDSVSREIDASLNRFAASFPDPDRLPLTSGAHSFVNHDLIDSPEDALDQSTYSSSKSLGSMNTKPFLSVRPLNNIQTESSVSAACCYFSVMWCKMSKKKHKKWEGDAVLVTSGRTASLYDMEGKVIGKGTGYKTVELQSLKEDESLFVGGKEIQVMSILSEADFKSGKCFTAASAGCGTAASNGEQRKNLAPFKPFSNPMRKQGSTTATQPQKPVIQCCNESKHDPNAPGALVMPRPSQQHQWAYNKSGAPLIDVVVDPYLSTSLRDHQRKGIIFLYECVMGMRDYHGQGAILADDMGLGKTLQCITLLWTLLKQGPYGGKPIVKKVLVITPGSLVKNWYQEFKKWLGTERLNVYAVSGDKRAEDFVKSGLHPVLVISYEMFVRCYDSIKDVPFDLVICDEGHRLKNTAIKTTSLIMSLPCRRRVVLTGTPVQNDLQEFFSIVEFCNPGILGSSAAFKRVYEEPIVASRQPSATVDQKELGEERTQELSRLTQMFVLRRTQEINNAYLPPKVELVLFCRPSNLQLTLYRQLLRSQTIRRCLTGNLSGSPHLVCIGALKQLCNHPGLVYQKSAEMEMKRSQVGLLPGDEGENWEDSIFTGLLSYFPTIFDPNTVNERDSGKLEVLGQILSSIWKHSNTDKVVLVSNHTKTLDVLQVFCDLQGYGYLRLDGQTPTAQRQDIVTRFNSRYCNQRIFLLSSKAGGVGLNLTGASRLILYDIDWNPANDLQAMARVWRDGQTSTVHVYRLLTTGTIEEKMYQRQITKQGLSGAVMDLSDKNNVTFSLQDLKDLFSLNEMTACETHSKLACTCQGDGASKAQLAETKEPTMDGQRSCQLGGSSVGKKSSNLTMAELLHWNHWHGHLAKEAKSWRLEETESALSFVFWQETNAQPSRELSDV